MQSVNEIVSAILAGNFSNADIHAINDAVKFKHTQLGKKNMWTICKNQEVWFIHTKTGKRIDGYVTAMNRTTISIQELNSNNKWRVPSTMVNAV